MDTIVPIQRPHGFSIGTVLAHGASELISRWENDAGAVMPLEHVLIVQIDPNTYPAAPDVNFVVAPKRGVPHAQ